MCRIYWRGVMSEDWTCNYRSYSYTTRSGWAGRWAGRKARPRCRRRWLKWERWRQSPPWSVLILCSSQWNISPPSSSTSTSSSSKVEEEPAVLSCISGRELIMTDREDREDGLYILPHLHQLPPQYNQTSPLGTHQRPTSPQIYSLQTQSVSYQLFWTWKFLKSTK